MTCSRTFSWAFRQLHILASKFDGITERSVSFVTGKCNYIGFGFTGHSNDLNNWMQNCHISLGGALMCLRCSSTKNWDECVGIQKVFPCPNEADQCYKLLFKGEKDHVQEENYKKGCTTSRNCTQLNEELCRMKEFGPGTTCEISWCIGDLCNTAALQMVSTISFIACACLAFLYWGKPAATSHIRLLLE